MKITISTPDGKPSWLKIAPRQSSELIGSAEIAANPAKKLEKILVKHGQVLHVKDANIDRDSHVRLEFDKPAEFKLGGKIYTWPEGYVFSKHCKGYNAVVAQKVVAATPFSAAGSSKLIVPCTYRSQVDNSGDTGQGPGWRHCASTSAVMMLETAKGLKWLKSTTKGFAQPEDWYTTQLTKKGFDTTDPQAHVSMLDGLGVPVSFRYDCSISDMNKTLERGFALMAGVQWRVSGHYVVFSGRDLVTGDYFWRDPYGLRAFDGDDPLDEYVTIGSGGDLVRLSMKKVQNVWLDLGDRAGWALYPKDGTYGFNYQKPVVELVQAVSPVAAPQGVVKSTSHSLPPKSAPEVETTTGNDSITILVNTWLKNRIENAISLPATDKQHVTAGSIIKCQVVGAKSNHGVLLMSDGATKYIFNAHFSGQEHRSGDVANMKSRSPVELDKLKAVLAKIANPNVPKTELDMFCETFCENASKYTITKREHAIHFLAQCLHESGGLLYLEELASGADYDYRDDLGNLEPEAIALAAKNNTTVGCFYKGRGAIQCTGWVNYQGFEKRTGIPATKKPHLLAEYPAALISALDFWATRGPSLSEDVDKGGMNEATVIEITKVVNGGRNGLADRVHYFHCLNEAL